MSSNNAKVPEGTVLTEDGSSVRFHRIGDVEFWVTPRNRIFIIIGKRQSFPTLYRNSQVRFDDPRMTVTPEVQAFLIKKLQDQRRIRLDWRAEDQASALDEEETETVTPAPEDLDVD